MGYVLLVDQLTPVHQENIGYGFRVEWPRLVSGLWIGSRLWFDGSQHEGPQRYMSG